jgi:hypothetical protein
MRAILASTPPVCRPTRIATPNARRKIATVEAFFLERTGSLAAGGYLVIRFSLNR